MKSVATWLHTRVYGVRSRNKRGNWEILRDKEESEHVKRMLGYREREMKAQRSESRALEKALGTYEDLNKDYVMERTEQEGDVAPVDGVGMIIGAIKGLELPGGDHTRGAITGFLTNPDNRDKVNMYVGNKFNEFMTDTTKGGKKKMELISK